MISSNLKIHTCDFKEYLALPGWSYSGIRMQDKDPIEPTEKMQLGTDVHNYLLTPEGYEHKNKLVRPIAVALKQRLGVLFQYLEAEIAVTSNFESQGFSMPYKGRLDLCIRKRIVIDIKVSENLNLDYFGYPYQLNGYAAAIKAPVALIISIHPKTYQTKLTNIPIDTRWWEHQVIQKGEPIYAR